MRTLGYSTLLAASLVVAPACSKKDEKSGDTDAKKAADSGAKVDDKKAEAAGDESAAKGADGGLAAAAGGSAKLAAGGFPASIGLIPDQAQFILGLSPKAISGSPIYALMQGEFDKDQDFQQALSAFKDCGLDPSKFDSVVLGGNIDENFVAVMVGDGIGEDKNATCVIKNIQKLDGDAEVADVVDQDGKKVIQFTGGRAYLVDGRTLAIATTSWESAVGGLIDGKGTAAASASKKDLFGKVNGSASIWGVATVPAEVAGMAPMFGAPPEFSNVQSVTGSVDLSNGAAIEALAVFSGEDKAKSVADQLTALLGEASKGAPAELANVVKSVKIEAAGVDLKIAMTATMDDINKAKDIAPPI